MPDAVPDRVFSGVGYYDQLGSVVGSAGDMNGDGHPDVFASAPYNDAGALNAGAIYVWFGGPAFDTTPDLTLAGSGVNEHLMNAANAGDVNGDGFSDLIGADNDHVFVWFGGSHPNSVPDLTLARRYASVAGAGDVDGDGTDDFVVGAAVRRYGRPCFRLLWWKRRGHCRGPALRRGSPRRRHGHMRRGWGTRGRPGPHGCGC